VRDRRTILREDFVARFATDTLKHDARPTACATLRALACDTLLPGLLLLSRP